MCWLLRTQICQSQKYQPDAKLTPVCYVSSHVWMESVFNIAFLDDSNLTLKSPQSLETDEVAYRLRGI